VRRRAVGGTIVNVLGKVAILLGMGWVFVWTWYDERFVSPADRRVRLHHHPGTKSKTRKTQ
jgi:hypothetical protein